MTLKPLINVQSTIKSFSEQSEDCIHLGSPTKQWMEALIDQSSRQKTTQGMVDRLFKGNSDAKKAASFKEYTIHSFKNSFNDEDIKAVADHLTKDIQEKINTPVDPFRVHITKVEGKKIRATLKQDPSTFLFMAELRGRVVSLSGSSVREAQMSGIAAKVLNALNPLFQVSISEKISKEDKISLVNKEGALSPLLTEYLKDFFSTTQLENVRSKIQKEKDSARFFRQVHARHLK